MPRDCSGVPGEQRLRFDRDPLLFCAGTAVPRGPGPPGKPPATQPRPDSAHFIKMKMLTRSWSFRINARAIAVTLAGGVTLLPEGAFRVSILRGPRICLGRGARRPP